MSEVTTPTEETVTLSPEDAQALQRFKATERKAEIKAGEIETEKAILHKPNDELNECIGDCRITKGTKDFDDLKANTSTALFEVNAKFEQEFEAIINSQTIEDADKTRMKDELINKSLSDFEKVISNMIPRMVERQKQAESTLFSNNRGHTNIDASIMNNPAFVEQLMENPYNFMDKPHGASNAQIILTLADRGFLSDTFMVGKGNVYEAANRRFTPEALKTVHTITANAESIDKITARQRSKYAGLKSTSLSQRLMNGE